MPKRGLGTQVAIFTIVVVIAVATVGLVSLSQPGSPSKTSRNGATQATFLYHTMPKDFEVGGYKFYMGYNGTGFANTVNGSSTVNLGFNLELIVSNGLTNQTIVFGWAPPAPSPGALPTPDKASLFGGGVELDWSSNFTGTYLQVSANSGTSSITSTTEANGSVSASRTWGLWSFQVSMNSTSVRVGGAINLDERLTYLGNANTTMTMVNPVSSASVYNSTGAQVWEWTPGGVIWRVTVYPGETFGDPICIPTAMLNATEENLTHCFFNFREEPVPGVYSVVAEPILLPSSGQDLGQNLQISLNFTITS